MTGVGARPTLTHSLRRTDRDDSSKPVARAAALAIVLLATMVSGCTLQLESPKLEVVTQPAYSSRDVLIPYELQGDGAYAEARWALRRYVTNVGEWELSRTWEVSVPNGSAGILHFELEDGLYALTGELLISRGGLTTTAPGLTSETEFYVDTIPPWGPIILSDSQGGGPDPLPPYDPAVALEIYPTYGEPPDLNTESPVELYHNLDTTVPPTQDQDPTGDTILMWDGGASSYSHVLTIIPIDQAGNIGSPRVEIYNAP